MHAKNLPRHVPILDKLDAEELACSVAGWFGHCLRFLAVENWVFTVDSDGKYLRGDRGDVAEPDTFERVLGSWSLKLCCRPPVGFPRNAAELTYDRQRLHKAVTIVLMNLTSSAKAGKLLADLRKEHKLAKLRRVDIM